MATIRENLERRYARVAEELAEIDKCSLGGKPNVKDRDGGTTIDHVGYRKSLYDELEMLQKLIDDLDIVEGDDGPFEVATEFIP